MNEKERHEVEELLDVDDDSAGGLMTTEFVAVAQTATVEDVLGALRAYEGGVETVTDVFLLDEKRRVVGVVALSQLLLTPRETAVSELSEEHVVSANFDSNARKVAELFDKYNLRCLPVVDDARSLVGVVHAEDVIAWLRHK
jgi:Mg/Co/Ni transporter MgtE